MRVSNFDGDKKIRTPLELPEASACRSSARKTYTIFYFCPKTYFEKHASISLHQHAIPRSRQSSVAAQPHAPPRVAAAATRTPSVANGSATRTAFLGSGLCSAALVRACLSSCAGWLAHRSGYRIYMYHPVPLYKGPFD